MGRMGAKKPRKKPPEGNDGAKLPDLSHIAESLRPLAVPIDSLTLDPANARLHDIKNLDAISGSLTVYGQQKPVVVRRETGVVVAGNGTVAAARALGWTHLAAVVSDMDAATAAGFSVADNRASDLSYFDGPALDKLLREVSTGGDERLDAMLAELASESAAATVMNMAAAQAKEPAAEGKAADNTGFKQFACPLTVAQELLIRRGIKEAKAAKGAKTSGEALYFIVREWLDARSA